MSGALWSDLHDDSTYARLDCFAGDASSMANRSDSKSPHSLREQAEAAWQGQRRDSATTAPEDAGALVHELEVHQIELELQNEELRRAQSELEESRDELSDLYDFAPVGYLTLSEDTVILRSNLRAAALLGVERQALIGKRFTRFLPRNSPVMLPRCRRPASQVLQPFVSGK